MNASFTPAPWTIHTEKGKIGILTENNVDHLATCYGFRKEQNARLIAAAPNMFVALQEMLSMFKDHRNYGDDEATAVKLALAAINLATEQ